ncbi:MAG: FAD-dependent oxidoreductase [Candidatus Gracilibacteria bacterium]|nr:FAD-dependent oxidoreductase [Candidatus Gracilibacteria bacterium]
MKVIQNFKLINKKNLTPNVYELDFESDNDFSFKPGQFITFLIPVGGRAYSILEENGKNIKLIIKKRELSEGGRGGSKYLCELEIGTSIRGVGPAGHFTLKENEKNKLFLGTGTGFVPLYNQIIYGLKNKLDCNFKLIFGARNYIDLFYINELNNLKNTYNNFDFEVYLSREEINPYKKGYITDFLNYETKDKFEEVYICGMPNMIDSSIEILIEKGFKKEDIFTEKY